MGNNCEICSTRCMGYPGNRGGCCTVDDRDYIIGPHTDSEEFVKRLSEKFGREIQYEEVFVEYSEGRKIFPNKPTWQDPNSYPALRLDFSHLKLPCIFYNTKLGVCSVYEIRPEICDNYKCSYLIENS